MEGGTEAFTNLGRHCEQDSCYQLDFLPFNCEGCQKVFCLEHRTVKAHNCPKADYNSRIVVVCETCSVSMEKKAGEDVETILEKHKQSGQCDPVKKHKPPKCPVKGCKEKLTFSNTSTCKICHQKVCLKHRFPAEHACKPNYVKESKFLLSLAARSGTDCRGQKNNISSPPDIKAF